MNKVEHTRKRTVVVTLRVGITHTYVSVNDQQALKSVDKLLDNLLSSPILPEAVYTNSFLDGTWDGKEHYYNRKYHFFHSGLYHNVYTALKLYGFEVNLIVDYERPREIPETPVIDTRWNPSYKLYPYQFMAVKKAMERNGIIHVPTGGGKTIIGARIIHKIGLPAVFFVHTTSLLHQTRQVLQELLDTDVGIIGDGLWEVDYDIIVASIQTIDSVLDATTYPTQLVEFSKKGNNVMFNTKEHVDKRRVELARVIERTRVVLFDECHHLSALTFTNVARMFKHAPFRYGLSATPFRTDRRDMAIKQLTGDKIYSISLEELISEGYLAEPRIHMVRLVGVKPQKRSKRYSQTEIVQYLSLPERNQVLYHIVKNYTNMTEYGKRNILIMTHYVKHAKRLFEFLKQYYDEDSIALIMGSTSSKRRIEYMQRFEDPNDPMQILVATNVFGEGVNLPTIDVLILAFAGKSVVKTYQVIGRALRVSKNKKKVTIIDLHDVNHYYLNKWGIERLQTYKEEPIFEKNLKILQLK